LPPAITYEEKRNRVAAAREVFQRYIPHPAVKREKKLKAEREAELKIISLSLTPGDTVTHDVYGLGTVVSTFGSGSESEAAIDFGTKFGLKHLLLAYAPLHRL